MRQMREVSHLTSWCAHNNLSLNVEKTKAIVVDFRRAHTQHPPLTINGAAVERVSSTKFLGVHVSEDLSWTTNTTSLARRAHQRLHFLRKLRRAGALPPIMCTFYRGTIESVLTSCVTVWYGACTTSCNVSYLNEETWVLSTCLFMTGVSGRVTANSIMSQYIVARNVWGGGFLSSYW